MREKKHILQSGESMKYDQRSDNRNCDICGNKLVEVYQDIDPNSTLRVFYCMSCKRVHLSDFTIYRDGTQMQYEEKVVCLNEEELYPGVKALIDDMIRKLDYTSRW